MNEITEKQLRQRASKLYSDVKRRSAPTYWKSGRLAGRMRWPGVPVPYDSQKFLMWLVIEIGTRVTRCRYCNAPVDVLSMSLDHDVPLHSGGSNEFSNLALCCADCNNLKGRLTGLEFMAFRRALESLSLSAQADIRQRLRAGAMGLRLRHTRVKRAAEVSELTTMYEGGK